MDSEREDLKKIDIKESAEILATPETGATINDGKENEIALNPENKNNEVEMLKKTYEERKNKTEKILSKIEAILGPLKTKAGNISEVESAYTAYKKAEDSRIQNESQKREDARIGSLKMEQEKNSSENESQEILDFDLSSSSKKNISDIREHIKNIEEQLRKTNSEESSLLLEQNVALHKEACNEIFRSFLRYLDWMSDEAGIGFLNESYEKISEEKKKKLDKISEYVLREKPTADVASIGSDEKVREWLTKITKALVNKK